MATFDWTIDQPNVVTVPERNMTVLSGKNDGEQYIVRYVDPKGCIEQRLVQSSAAAAPVTNQAHLAKDLEYTMSVQLDKSEPVQLGQDLNLEDHAIWAGAHGIASKLAAGKTGFTLWPGAQSVIAQNLTVPANYDGTLKIDVHLSDGQRTSLHAVYPELSLLEHEHTRQLSADQLDFQKRFSRGDPQLSAMLPNVHALCGTDVSGNQVKLFWHVKNEREAQLVDIEYPLDRLNGEAYPNAQTIQFACDPADLDQVTGLVMALEDKMAAGDLEGPVIQRAFETINAHRKTLETDQEHVYVSPKVNAAVKEATDALWQNIDGQARQRKYRDKLRRRGALHAIELAEELKERMRKAIEYGKDKKGPKSWLSTSRKSLIRKDITDLREAVDDMKAQTGLKESEVELYEQALKVIEQALRQ